MLKKGSWILPLVICLLAIGCGSTRPPDTSTQTSATTPTASARMPVPASVAADVPCTETKDRQFELTVSDDASVAPDCLVVKTGHTTLTWKADSTNVESLTVKFNPGQNCRTPTGPTCTGTSCILDRAMQSLKGVFEYSVYVVHKDGTTSGTDPVLIIKP